MVPAYDPNRPKKNWFAWYRNLFQKKEKAFTIPEYPPTEKQLRWIGVLINDYIEGRVQINRQPRTVAEASQLIDKLQELRYDKTDNANKTYYITIESTR